MGKIKMRTVNTDVDPEMKEFRIMIRLVDAIKQLRFADQGTEKADYQYMDYFSPQ